MASSPKRPRKPSKGKPVKRRARKLFPRKKNHVVSDAVARGMRRRYLEKYGRQASAIAPGAYSRDIFDRILAQPGCVGIRFYPGLDPRGRVTMLFCGVDRYRNDILAGIIGDAPWRCPPVCSEPNGTLQF